MRDFGFDFYWSDPYTKNEMARGFEIQIGKKYSLLTTFESFEHFEEPFDEVRKMLKISDTIIASTELLPKKLSIHWWYLGTEHGQHISIYTAKALQELSKRLGLFYYNLDNIHILSKKKMSIWGRFLFQSYFAKYFLYAFSYIINPFLKTKTFDDMNRYKHLS